MLALVALLRRNTRHVGNKLHRFIRDSIATTMTRNLLFQSLLEFGSMQVAKKVRDSTRIRRKRFVETDTSKLVMNHGTEFSDSLAFLITFTRIVTTEINVLENGRTAAWRKTTAVDIAASSKNDTLRDMLGVDALEESSKTLVGKIGSCRRRKSAEIKVAPQGGAVLVDAPSEDSARGTDLKGLREIQKLEDFGDEIRLQFFQHAKRGLFGNSGGGGRDHGRAAMSMQ